MDGFDTRFPDGEDFDFAVRALLNGIKIPCDNLRVAWHNDWPDIFSFIKRQKEYTKAKILIFESHPEYKEYFPSMIPKEQGGIKKLIGVIFKGPLLWLVTSGNVIFANLPQKAKFVMYNYAVAFNSNTNAA